MPAASLSIVIPVLDDAEALGRLLARLQAAAGGIHEATGTPMPECGGVERIVVDGSSSDDSAAVARAGGARVVSARRGRGHQLAAGIAAARAPWIWMLHADNEPTADALAHLLGRSPDEPRWGRFAVSLAPGTPLETIAVAMNWRSRLTGICTGDQGIFVHRSLLAAAGGMPEQSLMEDIELSRRLKRLRPPDCRPERIGASPRRWRRRGAVRTVLSMWLFRLRYWAGADAEHLAREYYRP